MKHRTKSAAALRWLTPVTARCLLRLIAYAQNECRGLECVAFLVGACVAACGEHEFNAMGDARSALQKLGDPYLTLGDGAEPK